MSGDWTDDSGHDYILPFSRAVRFHGHVCPGLAIGYYASNIAMRWLYGEKAPEDEVVAVIETAGCPVDAVQVITGCTTGKGNLVVHDSGRLVFTFLLRGRGKGVRISLKPEYGVDRLDPGLAAISAKISSGTATNTELDEFRERVEAVCRAILGGSGGEMFDIRPCNDDLPR